MNSNISIIGGGPAGISTAIQLKRYKFEPTLFEKDELGGLTRNAHRIENYLGFPKGISGIGFIKLCKKQLMSYNVNVIKTDVRKLEYIEKENKFLLSTKNTVYCSDIVIVASGSKPKKISLIDSLPKDLKRNIYYEIYPIHNKRNKRIIIVGAGDIAFDYALNLSRSNKIILINRNNKTKALPLLKDRIGKTKKIHIVKESVLRNIAKGKKMDLLITLTKKGTSWTIESDYIVFAIGRLPQKDFFSTRLIEIEKNLISREKLYLVGDAKNGNFRQIAIAHSNGIEAAMRIHQKSKEI